MILVGLILVPLIGALALAALPAAKARAAATATTLIVCVLGIAAAGTFDWSFGGSMQFPAKFDWIPSLGLSFSVGTDSVALSLILLTVLLGPICVISSATAITEREKTYYGWLLILQAAMTGVFASRDLLLFYICFEFTLIPMYILISLYGSTNRKAAATKFFLYTFTGSVIALAGFFYVVWFNATQVPKASTLIDGVLSGEWTLDIATLEAAARKMPADAQAWVLGALLLGFAVKVPLFPLHTWLPLAHTEAPTAGSVILAGVLLKLGTYAIYRFAIPFAPAAFVEYAPFIAAVSVIGILYGGLICWVQTDVKKLVAYSSVAHLGFCILGLAALNNTGVTGSILYMINHGLSTGALFLLIGMVYERYHTRSMKELGGLASKMPVWSTFMVFFTMASVGLPGLNGFVSEFLCLFGAFQASPNWGHGLWGTAAGQAPGGTSVTDLGPWLALLAGIGMIIAAIYLLYMVGKVVWGPLVEPHGHGDHGHDHHAKLPPDLTGREVGVLVPLAVLCVALGVYPQPLIDALKEPVTRTVVNAAENSRLPAPAAPVHTHAQAAEAGR